MRGRKLAAVVAAALIAAAAAIPAIAATTSVAVKDSFFSKRSLTVRKGTTVRWVWRGHQVHNVTVTRGPVRFRSGNKLAGSYSKTLRRAGTYTIVCTIHPGMKMTLRVR